VRFCRLYTSSLLGFRLQTSSLVGFFHLYEFARVGLFRLVTNFLAMRFLRLCQLYILFMHFVGELERSPHVDVR